MMRRPPRSRPLPTRRSSNLAVYYPCQERSETPYNVISDRVNRVRYQADCTIERVDERPKVRGCHVDYRRGPTTAAGRGFGRDGWAEWRGWFSWRDRADGRDDGRGR